MITNSFQKIASLRPANTDEQQLYVVPADTEIVASLTICNQDSSARTYRVARCDAGHGDVAANGDDWKVYDKTISPYDTHEISVRAKDGETIRVKASASDKISFVLEGMVKVVA